MKRIYLIRHGEAEDAGLGMRDCDRRLTDRGAAQSRNAALALQSIEEIPARFASSRLMRAKQTAAVIAAALDGEKPIETDTLDPGNDPNDTIDWIASRLDEPGCDSILLAGHNPSIGVLASTLLAGNSSVEFHFRKGSLLCLTSSGLPGPGRCTLEWFVTPDQLSDMESRTSPF